MDDKEFIIYDLYNSYKIKLLENLVKLNENNNDFEAYAVEKAIKILDQFHADLQNQLFELKEKENKRLLEEIEREMKIGAKIFGYWGGFVDKVCEDSGLEDPNQVDMRERY